MTPNQHAERSPWQIILVAVGAIIVIVVVLVLAIAVFSVAATSDVGDESGTIPVPAGGVEKAP